MNNQDATVVREALTRELEHHIEELCDILIKDITLIKEKSNVTVNNFELMSYLGESLESMCDASEQIIKYFASLKVAEKIVSTSAPITFKVE